jgi:hypothetical protein
MTPNATDQYTRFMVGMFDEREVQNIPTAFQSFFGGNASSRTVFEEDAGTIEIDILRANGERLAPTVHRGQASTPVDTENNTDEEFTNFVRKWPLIEKESHINSDQLLKRLAGENPFSGRTKMDRNRQLAKNLHFDDVRKTIRTMEFLAMQSILTGTQPAKIGTSNPSLIYDFRRKSTHNVNVVNPWNGGSAAINDDLDDACELIEADAYSTPKFCGIGDDAMAALIRDDEIQTVADNRRFELIQVSTKNPVPPEFERFIKAGWIARGLLKTLRGRNLWLFNNNQRYTNSAGVSTRYMPSDKAFILDTDARMDRYFGPRDGFDPTAQDVAMGQEYFGFSINTPPMPSNVQAPGIIDPRMFYFDFYRGKGNKTITLRSQSAPIYPTTQTDAIVVLSNLIS